MRSLIRREPVTKRFVIDAPGGNWTNIRHTIFGPFSMSLGGFALGYWYRATLNELGHGSNMGELV